MDGEIDQLERGLLVEQEEAVIYRASFEETEDNLVKYETARWVLYSLLLLLAWGIGLIMLIYLPLRRYIVRKDIRSRKLCLTPNAIVYKVEYYSFFLNDLFTLYSYSICPLYLGHFLF